MVRATAAEMLKLFGGTYPPGHDATSFGDVAVHADALIDAYSLPAVAPTTGIEILGLANRIAVHIINHAQWLSAGGVLSGFPDPPTLEPDILELLDKINMDTTADGWHTLDMIDEDD